MKKSKQKKAKAPSVSSLKKEADAVFSVWVRQHVADQWGRATCFTCGVRKPWRDLQAGHYVSRMHSTLRYDERNVHPQCVGCNIFKHGNLDEYALSLQEMYGQQILKDLARAKRDTHQFTIAELQGIIARYQ
jgi:hypothetical protein